MSYGRKIRSFTKSVLASKLVTLELTILSLPRIIHECYSAEDTDNLIKFKKSRKNHLYWYRTCTTHGINYDICGLGITESEEQKKRYGEKCLKNLNFCK